MYYYLLLLLCSEAHSDRKHRLHVQKPSEHKTQFPLPLKPSHRHYCLNTSVLLCGIFPTHQTSYNLSEVHSLSVVHSLSIILGILGFKLVIICGSFQSLVIVSDILSWCVLHGPCQCNIFFIQTFSRSDAGNSTCPNKQKVRGKEGASVTLKCIYRLYNVHLRWYRLQPS